MQYINPEQERLNPENEAEALNDATQVFNKMVLFAGPTIGGIVLGLVTDALKAAAPVPFVVGSLGVVVGLGLSGSYHFGLFKKCSNDENNQVANNNLNTSIQDEGEDELADLDNRTIIQIS